MISGKEGQNLKLTQNNLLAIVLFVLLVLVSVELTGHHEFTASNQDVHHEVQATVVAADNSETGLAGPLAQKSQYLTVRVADGEFKGVSFNAAYQCLTFAGWGRVLDVEDSVVVDLKVDDYGDVTAVSVIN